MSFHGAAEQRILAFRIYTAGNATDSVFTNAIKVFCKEPCTNTWQNQNTKPEHKTLDTF